MAEETFSWPSLRERAGRGDRTRRRLHAQRTRFRSSYRARLMKIWGGKCLKELHIVALQPN